MSFMSKYTEAAAVMQGVPGVELNAPYVIPNVKAKIGIELEIEGRHLPNIGHLAALVGPVSKAAWTTKPDGSLRGEAMEYVLHTPCLPEEVEQLLVGMWGVFAQRGTVLNPSNRCSTHVHVNVGGRKLNELTSIIALWTTFEDALIEYCGEERTTNHFCLSSKETNALITGWNGLLSGRGENFGEGMKYSALNVRTMHTLGSFEFRTMRMDVDYRPLLDWSLFINGMCEFAVDKYKNPSLLANDLSERGASNIFAEICDKALVSEDFIGAVMAQENFVDRAMAGFRRAQPLILGHPWGTWMELVEKEYIPSPFGTKTTKRAFRGEVPDALLRAFDEAQPRRGAGRLLRDAVVPTPLNPGEGVDTGRTIWFGDGTPAAITREGDQSFSALPLEEFRNERWRENYPLRDHAGQGFNYRYDNGNWLGGRLGDRRPWVTNRNPNNPAVEGFGLAPDDF